MKRPTQSDVAKRAGVSRATVSYVLNDPQHNLAISRETRIRVLQAMDDLGYQPDTSTSPCALAIARPLPAHPRHSQSSLLADGRRSRGRSEEIGL
ncbi:MAG: LacI family DNA-binding transcriptional regulator [Deinococcales bacterium]